MECLNGIIARSEMPAALAANTAQRQQLCQSLMNRLVQLHQVPWENSRLRDLYREGDYVERQVRGWSERFRAARTDKAPDFEAVMAWLEARRPAQVSACVIHNDYRFDNVVLNPESPMEVIGVLDWEMATIGDPLMDLGCSLAYWVEAGDPAPLQALRRQPSHLPGMLTRRELVDYYCRQAGRRVDDFAFYEVFGLFRLAVILQQIYYRYHHGQTQDPRFAGFIEAVQFLEQYLQQKISTPRA